MARHCFGRCRTEHSRELFFDLELFWESSTLTFWVLYYSQFAFNGVYLALFVYDKSTKPNRSSLETKRQKMMSKKSRSTDT
ncbi:hypothetical protein M3Y98_00545800 [Aphelenchoides besseyi]|nr:hypothetical protein M3Y98_00545800 [Aphelenchoides besseyi]